MKAKRALECPAAAGQFLCCRDRPKSGRVVRIMGWMAALGRPGDAAGAAEPAFPAV